MKDETAMMDMVASSKARGRAGSRPAGAHPCPASIVGGPLFLQVKEARASALEPYAGASVFANHGERVVNGYRLMQPASDMFLGWGRGVRDLRHYFVRRLKDTKISVRVETFGRAEMDLYATWWGRALALSHARSGSSAVLSGYMGRSDAFDRAIAAFSMACPDQNEKDHTALDRAVRKGKVKAVFEEVKWRSVVRLAPLPHVSDCIRFQYRRGVCERR